MNIETLHDLFVAELHRTYGIETQLVEELTTLTRDVETDALDDTRHTDVRESLREALEDHRSETQQHVDRLETALEALGRPIEARSTPDLDGVIEQKELFNNVVLSDDLRPVYYLGIGEQVEHLEITAYERLLRLADHLDVPEEVRDALERNLDEERAMLETVRSLSDDESVATLLEEQAAD